MGIISLCHPDTEKSCGACCGLYNWKDYCRKTVTEILQTRTDLFRHYFSKKEPKNLTLYQKEIEKKPHPPKMWNDLFNCEFLGFIDEDRRRVGCLLHPMVNDGKDYRDHGFYGKELCLGHECPSSTHLSADEKSLVVQAVDDWYLYGLIITDIDLVKDYYKHLRTRLGGSLKPRIFSDPDLIAMARDFFSLKESWEFRKDGRFGKYAFSYGEYCLARIGYEGLGAEESRYHKMLLSLGSSFETSQDLEKAEDILEWHIARFVARYQALDPLWTTG